MQKNLQKRHGNLVKTVAYIYAILLKVADKSMSAEQAVELIIGAISI